MPPQAVLFSFSCAQGLGTNQSRMLLGARALGGGSGRWKWEWWRRWMDGGEGGEGWRKVFSQLFFVSFGGWKDPTDIPDRARTA